MTTSNTIGTTTMITHQFVFVHLGENASTEHDPLCPLSEFEGNLDATVSRCASWDNDMQVTINKYVVRDVVLPDWLPVSEWVHNNIAWGYSWNRGVDPSWPEAWQRKLLLLGGGFQVACVKLLKTKKFRSPFRESLCNQLKAWFDGENDYRTPFTERQKFALVDQRDVIRAKQLDELAYRSRSSIRGVVVA